MPSQNLARLHEGSCQRGWSFVAPLPARVLLTSKSRVVRSLGTNVARWVEPIRSKLLSRKVGVEGFSEVMVTELAPLGVKVTILKPGGFRTDFAGSSQTIHKIRPEYDAIVGQAARFQRDYNGNQPGDPARAAQVILKVVRMDDPPIRLLLGSDALKIVQTADARKAAADRKWSTLSASTDFVATKT
jgi:NAD(P)-dependent dehydrogenase (short-subunit alcohol dehydrogenase family)